MKLQPTYKKPKDKSYTDLAIWIDNNAYSENCDDETLYKYLYILIYMLSYKRKFFKNFDDYDKYSIVTATRIFNRLKNRD